jgi:hypothetical protein
VLQHFTPDRHARLLDAVEKLFGGTAGLLLAGILQSSLWSKFISGNGRV